MTDEKQKEIEVEAEEKKGATEFRYRYDITFSLISSIRIWNGVIVLFVSSFLTWVVLTSQDILNAKCDFRPFLNTASADFLFSCDKFPSIEQLNQDAIALTGNPFNQTIFDEAVSECEDREDIRLGQSLALVLFLTIFLTGISESLLGLALQFREALATERFIGKHFRQFADLTVLAAFFPTILLCAMVIVFVLLPRDGDICRASDGVEFALKVGVTYVSIMIAITLASAISQTYYSWKARKDFNALLTFLGVDVTTYNNTMIVYKEQDTFWSALTKYHYEFSRTSLRIRKKKDEDPKIEVSKSGKIERLSWYYLDVVVSCGKILAAVQILFSTTYLSYSILTSADFLNGTCDFRAQFNTSSQGLVFSCTELPTLDQLNFDLARSFGNTTIFDPNLFNTVQTDCSEIQDEFFGTVLVSVMFLSTFFILCQGGFMDYYEGVADDTKELNGVTIKNIKTLINTIFVLLIFNALSAASNLFLFLNVAKSTDFCQPTYGVDFAFLSSEAFALAYFSGSVLYSIFALVLCFLTYRNLIRFCTSLGISSEGIAAAGKLEFRDDDPLAKKLISLNAQFEGQHAVTVKP